VTQAIDLAIAEIGTVEWAKGSNPKVVAYYKDAGFAGIKEDDVAWCAAFVGAMLKRAGVKPSNSLLARSYLKWGVQVPISQAKRGDIGVIPRGTDWQGHVFFIEKIEGGKVYAIGGNQKDSVSRTTFPVASLIGVRRAAKAAQPVDLGGAGNAPKPPKTPTNIGDMHGAETPAKPSFIAALIAWLFKGRR